MHSRSSALAVLWIMTQHNVSLKDAVEFVRERRKYINPNPGFLRELGLEEVGQQTDRQAERYKTRQTE